MSEEIEWQPISVPDGELEIEWAREHSHAISFLFFDEHNDEWRVRAGVKWDGCINWETNPNYLYHFCEPACVARLARAFDRAWEFTRDNLDVADAFCFAGKTA